MTALTGTFALIRFELERRWMAFSVALALGLLDFALPFAPSLARIQANEMRTLLATFSAAGLAAILAVVLGGSLAANDLAERRATFQFARPLGWAAIAFGRFAAALVIVIGAAALVLLPSLIAGGRLEMPAFGYELVDLTSGSALLAVGSVVLLLIASAIVVAARARTGWSVLEFGALVGAGLMLLRARDLLRQPRLPIAEPLLWLGVSAAGAIVLVALYAAVIALGRTDLARAHRAQALVGMVALLGVGAAGWAWANDYVTPSLREIWRGQLMLRAIGDGVLSVAGSEPGRDDLSTTFLLDARSGEWLRASQIGGGDPVSASRIVDRPDGSMFYWRRDAGGVELTLARRSASGFAVAPTRISDDRVPWVWAISSDASLLALTHPVGGGGGNRLDLYEIGRGRLLKSSHLPDFLAWNARLEPERDGFRLAFWGSDDALESWRIDADGTAHRTGLAHVALTDLLWRVDAEQGRIFVKQSRDQRRWLVLDAATLDEIVSLRPPLLGRPESWLTPLLASFPDGSIAASARTNDQRELDLYSASGELLRSSVGPVDGPTLFVGSGSDHTILLAWRANGSASDQAAGWVIDRYDLMTGDQRTVVRDLQPTSFLPLATNGPALLRDAHGDLFSLDPDSGALSQLARPRGVN